MSVASNESSLSSAPTKIFSPNQTSFIPPQRILQHALVDPFEQTLSLWLNHWRKTNPQFYHSRIPEYQNALFTKTLQALYNTWIEANIITPELPSSENDHRVQVGLAKPSQPLGLLGLSHQTPKKISHVLKAPQVIIEDEEDVAPIKTSPWASHFNGNLDSLKLAWRQYEATPLHVVHQSVYIKELLKSWPGIAMSSNLRFQTLYCQEMDTFSLFFRCQLLRRLFQLGEASMRTIVDFVMTDFFHTPLSIMETMTNHQTMFHIMSNLPPFAWNIHVDVAETINRIIVNQFSRNYTSKNGASNGYSLFTKMDKDLFSKLPQPDKHNPLQDFIYGKEAAIYFLMAIMASGRPHQHPFFVAIRDFALNHDLPALISVIVACCGVDFEKSKNALEFELISESCIERMKAACNNVLGVALNVPNLPLRSIWMISSSQSCWPQNLKTISFARQEGLTCGHCRQPLGITNKSNDEFLQYVNQTDQLLAYLKIGPIQTGVIDDEDIILPLTLNEPREALPTGVTKEEPETLFLNDQEGDDQRVTSENCPWCQVSMNDLKNYSNISSHPALSTMMALIEKNVGNYLYAHHQGLHKSLFFNLDYIVKNYLSLRFSSMHKFEKLEEEIEHLQSLPLHYPDLFAFHPSHAKSLVFLPLSRSKEEASIPIKITPEVPLAPLPSILVEIAPELVPENMPEVVPETIPEIVLESPLKDSPTTPIEKSNPKKRKRDRIQEIPDSPTENESAIKRVLPSRKAKAPSSRANKLGGYFR